MNNQISVIYEDENFLAIYKPAGTLTHSAQLKIKNLESKIKENILTDWLLEYYPEIKKVGDQPKIRPGIVHRLDKNTSGVILIARNQKYFEYLKNLFRVGQIKKTYIALVYGKVKSRIGVIKKAISIKSGTIKRTIWAGKTKKEAITEYKVLKFLKLKADKKNNKEKEEIFSLVKVAPKTGRTHQIRIHLTSIGHPIVGDSLYGKKTNILGLKRQFLHAESLEFSSGNNKRIKISAELPNELKNFLKQLKQLT